MKKLLAALTCGIITASCFVVTASAETDYKGKKLPFTLDAPSHVSLSWLEGGDSPTSTSISYSLNNSAVEWFSYFADPTTHDAAVEKLESEYKYEDLWIDAQVDWAIDDPENGWHYTKYWDDLYQTGYGHDEDGNSRTGPWDCIDGGVEATKTVSQQWILRGVVVYDKDKEPEAAEDNIDWNGNEYCPGLKNQLKEGQYDLITTDEEYNQKMVSIDWSKHTLYTRVRWAVTIREEEDSHIFSDWSETASYGKDASSVTIYTEENLSPPVISDLHYYSEDFNGYPQIACTLTVPEELSKALTDISSSGGYIDINFEARVPGGEWIGLQGSWEVTAGEMTLALQNLAEATGGIEKDSPIELRARYTCEQRSSWNGEVIGSFQTPYSEILTFGAQEMSVPKESSAVESSEDSDERSTVSSASETSESSTPPADRCSICGFCPHPLGLCIFIWLAILVAVIVIVVVVIIIVKKSKKKS